MPSAPQSIESFGVLRDGTPINAIWISNSHGVRVRLMSYGAAIVSVETPDRMGQMGDVVLGCDDVSGYEDERNYFGACVGRVANRIGQASFSLDDREYRLPANEGENHIHGGPEGFDRKVWKIDPVDSSSVRMSLLSPDGDQGYPGNLSVCILYTITDSNELRIAYTATTDAPTFCNLTNHSYFNLRGQGDVLDHSLTVYADQFTEIDDACIPTGILGDVSNKPCDFRRAATLREGIGPTSRDHGYNYCLPGLGEKLELVARVTETESGRTLECYTDQPGLQYYDGVHLNVEGKGGVRYESFAGFCLEPQIWPDAPNQAHFPSARLDPGETYRHTTVYKFGVEQET